MARTASGYHLVRRGVSGTWYFWAADGKGGKKWFRVTDASGLPIRPEATKVEASGYAAVQYAEWREAACVRHAVRTHGELTSLYVEIGIDSWGVSTRDQYRNWLEDQEHFLGVTTPLGEITLQRALAFQRWLADDMKLAPSTVNARIGLARAIFAFAERKRLIRENPFIDVKPRSEIRVRPLDPFSPEEVRRLLATARGQFRWFHPLLLIAMVTGCRDGALASLDVGDFRQESGVLDLPDHKAKGGRGMTYHLPAPCADLLRMIVAGRNPDEPLFVNRLGRRFSANSFRTAYREDRDYPSAWRRLLDAAGVPPRCFHGLRAAVDSNLTSQGATVDQAVSVTGHSASVARRSYIRIDPGTQRRMMDNLCGLYEIGDDFSGRNEAKSA